MEYNNSNIDIKSFKYVMRGKYRYALESKGILILACDTEIDDIIEIYNGFLVSLKGNSIGSIFVDSYKKLLKKQRIRKTVFRKST
jgi:hypothetical protein